MEQLKELVHPDHDMPQNVLPGAKTIIAYFMPFREEIGNTNKEGRLSSVEWAKAYEKTNAFLYSMNDELIAFLGERGICAAVSSEAGMYDDTILKSKWSQRHIAYYCGLGTLGINNMLITEAGCCGRISTVVTDLDVEHNDVINEEYCLFKRNGSCGACIRRCPVNALTEKGYDRRKCNGLCDENAAVHVGYCDTPSYTLSTDNDLVGSNTCGKCLIGVPCTYRIPKS
ncbi:MAG: epoxyqueuosine reductase [Firmicutes bacterium]|nr:epoxyqueuosine reductase [Bacillota bacterium]